ncbi:hypothetical protein LMTR3_22360 [Bradyrhizobium sp. LMTR 3]|nr:hypothetical protein LMTR3_22360 [Bradyrhizobium sp. LMTR 3]
MIVPDSGTGLTSMATLRWSQHRQIEWYYIPASHSDSFVQLSHQLIIFLVFVGVTVPHPTATLTWRKGPSGAEFQVFRAHWLCRPEPP